MTSDGSEKGDVREGACNSRVYSTGVGEGGYFNGRCRSFEFQ